MEINGQLLESLPLEWIVQTQDSQEFIQEWTNTWTGLKKILASDNKISSLFLDKLILYKLSLK